ncbi:hypothetical protein LAZ67_8004049 [Cordylochernes scorpioides]|uniref:Transposase Tc1-like domain-containing protein n=1 Tax=Cordylochernes scorpioides TaxID=51811 RepID=A0ABY6KVD1_9ARAC|nr:hypothetical protein LAZ67_8004049 [Cordylochernes scorpioides]
MLEMTRRDPEWKDKIITGDETWVYGYDPETKRQSAEWRGQGKRFEKKRPEKWTNGDWILHHDNARPHTVHLVTSFLAKNGTEILPQPPYSPDIAPYDFFLFPKLKAVLKGRHFDTREDIIEKSLLALKSIPKEAYKNCFDNWEKRWRCSTPISTVSMPHRKIRAHYEHMSEIETGRAIGLKEAGWSNRLIARHLCRSDAAIRQCWQKWVNNGSMQCQDGSGRPRATTEREDRAIVRMAVAAPESTLSTIQRVTGTQVSKMTINRRLRERNLRARRPLRCLPLTPVHRQGRIVFSDESRFLLCTDDCLKRFWRGPGQRVDPGLTVEHHTGPQQGVMVWGAISFDSRTPLVVIPGTLTAQRRLQPSRNVDYLARQLETIWQEIRSTPSGIFISP